MTALSAASPSRFFPQCPQLNRVSFADHEPGLWRAVITQALMDAATQSSKSWAKRARQDALTWLLSDESDFETVCDNAGLDPDYVRTKARKALARGCQWRLPVGQGWRSLARQAKDTLPPPTGGRLGGGRHSLSPSTLAPTPSTRKNDGHPSFFCARSLPLMGRE